MSFLGNDAKQIERRIKPSPNTRCKGRKLRMHRQEACTAPDAHVVGGKLAKFQVETGESKKKH